MSDGDVSDGDRLLDAIEAIVNARVEADYRSATPTPPTQEQP